MTILDSKVQQFMQLTDEEKEIYLLSKIMALEIEVKTLMQESARKQEQQEQQEKQKQDKLQELLSALSEEDRRCFELSKQGYTIKAIANKLGWGCYKTSYHRRKIDGVLKLSNMKLLPQKRRISTEEVDKFIEMTAQGYSATEISRSLGRTIQSIYQMKYRLKKQD